MISIPPQGFVALSSQFSFEGPVQDGGEQGVQFDGGLGLELFQGVHLGLEVFQIGHNTALFFLGGHGYLK